MNNPPSLKSVAEFMAGLERKNKTLAEWARENDFQLDLAYAVARGRVVGRRGRARDILIAMGITPPPMFQVLPAIAKKPSRIARAA